MIINRNSWHYKLMDDALDLNVPRSLCPYVRKLVFTLGVLAGLAMCALWFVAALICAPLGWFGVIDFPTSGNDQTVWEFLALFGTAMWGVIAILACGGGLVELRKRQEAKRYYSESKEPGLIRSYWKAVHDKVCPMLEFK